MIVVVLPGLKGSSRCIKAREGMAGPTRFVIDAMPAFHFAMLFGPARRDGAGSEAGDLDRLHLHWEGFSRPLPFQQLQLPFAASRWRASHGAIAEASTDALDGRDRHADLMHPPQPDVGPPPHQADPAGRVRSRPRWVDQSDGGVEPDTAGPVRPLQPPASVAATGEWSCGRGRNGGWLRARPLPSPRRRPPASSGRAKSTAEECSRPSVLRW